MTMTMRDMGREQVLLLDAAGPLIDDERAATDLIGDAFGPGASMIAIPAERLGPRFFDLRSGLAGAFTQKAVNYHLKLAVIGDIATHLAASKALGDWVREANRGRDLCFVPSVEALAERLAVA